jgi:chromate transporter
VSIPLTLFAQLLALSLLAVGGGVVLIPELHRLLVDQLHLLDDAAFTGSIALAQAAPGPNVLFVAVLGYRAAGLPGALASMLGVMLPSATLAFLAARWLRSHHERLSVRAFKVGMAPLVIALMCATGYTLVIETPGTVHVLLALAAALLVWLTRTHLLVLIAGGALVGALGFLE